MDRSGWLGFSKAKRGSGKMELSIRNIKKRLGIKKNDG